MRIGRWLFIIDGIITLSLALAEYIFFPNLPQSGKETWWTTEEEHLLSIKIISTSEEYINALKHAGYAAVSLCAD
jgi:hypothetical protein